MSVCFLTVLGIQCLRGVEAAKVTMSFTSQFFGGLPTSGGAWVLWGLVRILFFFFKGSSLQWIWDWKPSRAKPKDVSMKVERAVNRLLCACVPLIIRHKACRNPAVQSMLFQCDFAQCFTTLFFPFFFFFLPPADRDVLFHFMHLEEKEWKMGETVLMQQRYSAVYSQFGLLSCLIQFHKYSQLSANSSQIAYWNASLLDTSPPSAQCTFASFQGWLKKTLFFLVTDCAQIITHLLF